MRNNITRRYWRIAAFLILLLAAGIYFYAGARPDPRFSLTTLQGMTPEQVISRLGPPRIDQRLPQWGGWNARSENELGPLKFYYYDRYGWKGYEYAIIFKDNHVADVRYGTK